MLLGIKVTKNILEPPLPLPILAFFVFINLHLKDIGPTCNLENLCFTCFKKNFNFKIHLKKIVNLHAKKRFATNQLPLKQIEYPGSENVCNGACCGNLRFLKIV